MKHPANFIDGSLAASPARPRHPCPYEPDHVNAQPRPRHSGGDSVPAFPPKPWRRRTEVLAKEDRSLGEGGPKTVKGRDPISSREVIRLAAEVDWGRQREGWRHTCLQLPWNLKAHTLKISSFPVALFYSCCLRSLNAECVFKHCKGANGDSEGLGDPRLHGFTILSSRFFQRCEE